MIAIALAIALTAAVCGLAFLLRSTAKVSGAQEEAIKQKDEVLDAIDRANSVRDRLRTDGDFARSVQERFTRRD